MLQSVAIGRAQEYEVSVLTGGVTTKKTGIILLLLVLAWAACARRIAEVAPAEKTGVTIDWNKVIRVSNANATLAGGGDPLDGPQLTHSRQGL